MFNRLKKKIGFMSGKIGPAFGIKKTFDDWTVLKSVAAFNQQSDFDVFAVSRKLPVPYAMVVKIVAYLNSRTPYKITIQTPPVFVEPSLN